MEIELLPETSTWGAGRMADRGEIISVWRVVSPPGYGALGDVVSLGLDPPTAPVTVSPPFHPDHTCLAAQVCIKF